MLLGQAPPTRWLYSSVIAKGRGLQLQRGRSLVEDGVVFLFNLHNQVGLQMQGSGQGWGSASVLNFCVGVL